jgi:hypothetical protein
MNFRPFIEHYRKEMDRTTAQRDAIATVAGELVAAIRVNVMRGTFAEATIEQTDEWLKPWIEKIANNTKP